MNSKLNEALEQFADLLGEDGFKVGTKRRWKDGNTYEKQPDGTWAQVKGPTPGLKVHPDDHKHDKPLKATQTPHGLFVRNAPVHDPDKLKGMETLREHPFLGHLKIANSNAQVWLTTDGVVSIRWRNSEGKYITTARYRK